MTPDEWDDAVAALIAEVKPFGNGWLHCDSRHPWFLVTEAGTRTDTPVRWTRTFADMEAVNTYVRDGVTGDEHPVLLVHLPTGERHVPALVWIPQRCTWPTCEQPPAVNGRRFRGGRLCPAHTAKSHDLDMAARDELEQSPC